MKIIVARGAAELSEIWCSPSLVAEFSELVSERRRPKKLEPAVEVLGTGTTAEVFLFGAISAHIEIGFLGGQGMR